METLTSILIDTYNPNHDLRINAEKNLQQFLNTPGSLTVLICTIGNTAVHNDLRKATALLIKNRLRDYWATGEKALPTSEDEQAQFKRSVMDTLLAEQDNSIRGILAESVRIVSEFDYPQKWPELIPAIMSNIQSPDVLRIYNALYALRKLVKRYEYKEKEFRQPLNDILQALFPYLQELMKHIINNNSIEAAQVMRVCLKVFWSATNYCLPLVQGVDVGLWFNIIGQILSKVLPEASTGLEPVGQPTDPDERQQWPWWRLKKWAARIMTHFIQRYGNPRYAPEETKAFSEFFRTHLSVALLTPVMQNLEHFSRGGYLTGHVHRACISYLASCAEMSPTYKVMKPHMQFLLFQVIFPTLCLTAEDRSLFEDDPVEFIRQVNDPISDWLSPSVSAINLLHRLGRYRQKDTLPLFLPFLQAILTEYNQAAPEAKDYVKKDGVLVSFTSIAKIMSDSNEYAQFLFPFVINHVLPEFNSPVGFLRFRACWAIQHFSGLNWEQKEIEDLTVDSSSAAASAGGDSKKGSGKKKSKGASKKGKKKLLMSAGQLLSAVLQSLLRGLRDPALPVQSAAACSLQSLIEVDEAKEILRPMLKEIVAEYFRIMEEAGSESVLAGLKAIVTEFGDSIKEFAPMMVMTLVSAFNQYSQETEDEEATYNAVHCMDTIDAAIEAVQDSPEILEQVEPILQPLFLNVLTSSGNAFEYIDTVVHMISGLTYFKTSISPTMWSLCGPVVYMLNTWAIDYICEIMPAILNYMTKGMETFLSLEYDSRPVVLILMEAIGKAFDGEEGYSGNDISAGATLLTCLLTSCREQCPGKVHSLFPQIVCMVYTRSVNLRVINVKIRLLEVVMACMYYDPALTLEVFQLPAERLLVQLCPQVNVSELPEASRSIPLLDYFMPWLFTQLPTMKYDFTQRLVVLSLAAMWSVPLTSWPALMSGNMVAMFQQMIRELVMIEETAEKVAARGDDDDYEDVDDDDEDFDGWDEDDDADFDDDEEGGAPRGGKSHSADAFDDNDSKQAAIRRAKALYVPEGGYDEEEDCLNAEDEEYRQVLEDMDKEGRVKREIYNAGGEYYGDEDDEEAFSYTSSIEQMDVTKLFFEAMQQFSARESAVFANLRASLSAEDQQRWEKLWALAQQRHTASAT